MVAEQFNFSCTSTAENVQIDKLSPKLLPPVLMLINRLQ